MKIGKLRPYKKKHNLKIRAQIFSRFANRKYHILLFFFFSLKVKIFLKVRICKALIFFFWEKGTNYLKIHIQTCKSDGLSLRSACFQNDARGRESTILVLFMLKWGSRQYYDVHGLGINSGLKKLLVTCQIYYAVRYVLHDV